jgi:hypothetical protein
MSSGHSSIPMSRLWRDSFARSLILRGSGYVRSASQVFALYPSGCKVEFWVVGSIGTENRLKGDHPTARPQDLSDFEGVGALRASRSQAG